MRFSSSRVYSAVDFTAFILICVPLLPELCPINANFLIICNELVFYETDVLPAVLLGHLSHCKLQMLSVQWAAWDYECICCSVLKRSVYLYRM